MSHAQKRAPHRRTNPEPDSGRAELGCYGRVGAAAERLRLFFPQVAEQVRSDLAHLNLLRTFGDAVAVDVLERFVARKWSGWPRWWILPAISPHAIAGWPRRSARANWTAAILRCSLTSSSPRWISFR